MSQIARAIDVGYGNTKFVTLLQQESIQCGMFPSIAPQASSGPDLSGGLMQRRNTVVVEVDGVKYEVGKDARLAQDASHGRVLDPDYSMTDTHMALIRGALHYMLQPSIDLLVLGLPVNTWESYHDALAKKVIGKHKLPSRDRNKPDEIFEVEIRACRVIPQPLGAFFDYSFRSGTYEKMRNAYYKSDRENFLIELGKYGMGKRDMIPCLNLFRKVDVKEGSRLELSPKRPKVGEYIEFRADMNVLLVLSNTPHVMEKGTYNPSELSVVIYHGADFSEDDFCLNFSEEARRGFENNARYFA